MRTLLTLDLQFFNAEGEGRTEKATPKKREDARKKGQVAKSSELNTAFILLAFFGMMMLLGDYYIKQIGSNLTNSLNNISELVLEGTNTEFLQVVGKGIIRVVIINGPLWGGLFLVAFLVSIAQVGYKPTLKPMAPKFNKMNPLKGIKKIASKDTLVELVKSLCKVSFLGVIFINTLKGAVDNLFKFYDMSLLQILENIGSIVLKIGFSVSLAFFFVAMIDFAYQKYKHEDSIKMTKQEIKDEYKQAEGDPQIKGKIKQKMREMSMKRMMQEIPQADVIITNPTHFAVAITYDQQRGAAPIVVAKGVDYVAEKIKEKAKEHRIQIVQNKPLARTLYYTVEIGQEIPPELYNAVAEVLAYVYSLNDKKI